VPYITPPSTPESTTCRALLIPDSSDWLAIFGGALTELIYAYNWEQVEGISVTDALAVANTVINGFYEGCVESGCQQPGGYAVLRIGEDGHVEQLINGEWVPPVGEYAFPSIPARTEPTPTERRCLAAANAANVLQIGYEALADAFAEGLTTSQAVVRLIEALAVTWFWIAPILNGLVLILAGLMELVYQAFYYITADVWDADFTDILVCWLYECSASDGDIVTFNYDCLMEKMLNQVIAPPFDEAMARLAVQLSYLIPVCGGVDFLNQAGGTTAITLADCEGCTQNFCVEYPFNEDDWDWYNLSCANTQWVDGCGWQRTGVGGAPTIVFDFPTTTITRIGFRLTEPMAGNVDGLYIVLDGDYCVDSGIKYDMPGDVLAVDFPGGVVASKIEIGIQRGTPNSSYDYAGCIEVIVLEGHGERPPGGYDCPTE